MNKYPLIFYRTIGTFTGIKLNCKLNVGDTFFFITASKFEGSNLRFLLIIFNLTSLIPLFFNSYVDNLKYNNDVVISNWFNLEGSRYYYKDIGEAKNYISKQKLEYLSDKNRLPKNYFDDKDILSISPEWEVIRRQYYGNIGWKNPFANRDFDSDKIALIMEQTINKKEINIFQKFKEVWFNRFGEESYLLKINN